MSGESYDYFASYKARYLGRLFVGAPIKRILDYGSGVGSLAKHLCAEFPAASVDGFDPSPESISRIDDKVRQRGAFLSSLQDLLGPYDLIVLANVLHHVKPEERTEVFRKAFAMLAVGGWLVVFEHNPFNPLTRWAVSHCEFDRDAVLLTSAETVRRLKGAGFILRPERLYRFLSPRTGALEANRAATPVVPGRRAICCVGDQEPWPHASGMRVVPHELVRFAHLFIHVSRPLVLGHILPVWAVCLVIIIIGGLFLYTWSNQEQGFSSLGRQNRDQMSRRDITPAESVAIIVFVLFVIAYIAMILYKADFAYYTDNDCFTDFSVIGKPFAPPIWVLDGRFFPSRSRNTIF